MPSHLAQQGGLLLPLLERRLSNLTWRETPSSEKLLAGNPIRNLFYQQYAAFIQDDWRITPRLTLNLGLRYEAIPPVTEANNQFGNFAPNSPAGMTQQSGGNPVYGGADRNFEPRFGLAWDVTGKGNTVVRAGATSTYSIYPLLDLIGSNQGATLNNIPTGFALYAASTTPGVLGAQIPSPGTQQTGQLSLNSSQIKWAAGTPIFTSGAATLKCGNGISPNPATCSLNAIDPNFKLTQVITWTLGAQHAFNNNLSLEVSYVGNHGHLSGLVDVNSAAPGTNTTATYEQQHRPYYNQFPYLST